MRFITVLICFPIFMYSQSRDTDTTLYFNVQLLGSIPQPGIFEEPSIHGMGLGYSLELSRMVYKDKLGLSFKVLNQINQIENIYTYYYSSSEIGPTQEVQMIDRSATLHNYSLLLGLNYNLKLPIGLIIQPYISGGLNWGLVLASEPIYLPSDPGEAPIVISSTSSAFSEALHLGLNGFIPINDRLSLNLGVSRFLSFLSFESINSFENKNKIVVHNLILSSGITLKL